MNLILFDDPLIRAHLLPITYTRPISGIRCGILTIAEKWEHFAKASPSYLTEEYLSGRYGVKVEDSNYLVNGAICPDEALWESIASLEPGEGLYGDDQLLAGRLDGQDEIRFPIEIRWKKITDYSGSFTVIDKLWKIFGENADQIKRDYSLLTDGRKSEVIDDKHTVVYNSDQVFVESGVRVRAAIINAEDGPVYIGEGVTIQEGSILQGPISIGEHSQVHMGSKLRAETTIGPYCKAGGEIGNSILMGYSNKAHEGYLGNSVVGEWCNMGADTNTSNLKNNYAEVRLWNYALNSFERTGRQFCGLVMGDHSKCGINTMFNTGTVVGVGANIFGAGFPRNFVPSFSWGGAAGWEEYKLEKFLEVARVVMERRGIELDDIEVQILSSVFEQSAERRG